VTLPKTSGDKYRCYPTKLTEQLEMISGRVVTEIRGTVQVIEYAYDYMPDSQYKALLTALRSNPPLTVTYLPDDSSDMRTSDFIVTSYPTPTFAFAKGNKPYWHNVAFSMREVKPHD
jgi:hypothetical protein